MPEPGCYFCVTATTTNHITMADKYFYLPQDLSLSCSDYRISYRALPRNDPSGLVSHAARLRCLRLISIANAVGF
jgi:hypothetical protein